MSKMPPHNQRRLNQKVRDVYGGKYTDWYELVKERQNAGDTLEMIRVQFAALGINVSIFTVHNWIKQREADENAHSHFATSH